MFLLKKKIHLLKDLGKKFVNRSNRFRKYGEKLTIGEVEKVFVEKVRQKFLKMKLEMETDNLNNCEVSQKTESPLTRFRKERQARREPLTPSINSSMSNKDESPEFGGKRLIQNARKSSPGVKTLKEHILSFGGKGLRLDTSPGNKTDTSKISSVSSHSGTGQAGPLIPLIPGHIISFQAKKQEEKEEEDIVRETIAEDEDELITSSKERQESKDHISSLKLPTSTRETKEMEEESEEVEDDDLESVIEKISQSNQKAKANYFRKNWDSSSHKQSKESQESFTPSQPEIMIPHYMNLLKKAGKLSSNKKKENQRDKKVYIGKMNNNITNSANLQKLDNFVKKKSKNEIYDMNRKLHRREISSNLSPRMLRKENNLYQSHKELKSPKTDKFMIKKEGLNRKNSKSKLSIENQLSDSIDLEEVPAVSIHLKNIYNNKIIKKKIGMKNINTQNSLNKLKGFNSSVLSPHINSEVTMKTLCGGFGLLNPKIMRKGSRAASPREKIKLSSSNNYYYKQEQRDTTPKKKEKNQGSVEGILTSKFINLQNNPKRVKRLSSRKKNDLYYSKNKKDNKINSFKKKKKGESSLGDSKEESGLRKEIMKLSRDDSESKLIRGYSKKIRNNSKEQTSKMTPLRRNLRNKDKNYVDKMERALREKFNNKMTSKEKKKFMKMNDNLKFVGKARPFFQENKEPRKSSRFNFEKIFESQNDTVSFKTSRGQESKNDLKMESSELKLGNKEFSRCGSKEELLRASRTPKGAVFNVKIDINGLSSKMMRTMDKLK